MGQGALSSTKRARIQKITRKKTQLTLEDYFGTDYSYINIEKKCQDTLKAFGDPLAKKKDHHHGDSYSKM